MGNVGDIKNGMQLTDEDVRQFCLAYSEAYGEDLPVDEARMWAVRLVRLYRILLSPTPSEMDELLAKSGKRATLEPPTPAASVERQHSSPEHT